MSDELSRFAERLALFKAYILTQRVWLGGSAPLLLELHRAFEDCLTPEARTGTTKSDRLFLELLEAVKKGKLVHEEYLPAATTDFSAGAQRLIDRLKDVPGKKVIWIVWAGAGNPFKIADMDLKRYGIEIATGGNILPAMAAYKNLPGMEGATYYYFGIPKNPVNEAMVSMSYKQFKAPPDFFTAGGFSSSFGARRAFFTE
jgi:hypothetical protein